VYWIMRDGREVRFETRQAEILVQQLCDQLGIVWKAVPHPGGESQLVDTRAWIKQEERRRPSN
jgi:hypothetical protein